MYSEVEMGKTTCWSVRYREQELEFEYEMRNITGSVLLTFVSIITENEYHIESVNKYGEWMGIISIWKL